MKIKEITFRFHPSPDLDHPSLFSWKAHFKGVDNAYGCVTELSPGVTELPHDEFARLVSEALAQIPALQEASPSK